MVRFGIGPSPNLCWIIWKNSSLMLISGARIPPRAYLELFFQGIFGAILSEHIWSYSKLQCWNISIWDWTTSEHILRFFFLCYSQSDDHKRKYRLAKRSICTKSKGSSNSWYRYDYDEMIISTFWDLHYWRWNTG